MLDVVCFGRIGEEFVARSCRRMFEVWNGEWSEWYDGCRFENCVMVCCLIGLMYAKIQEIALSRLLGLCMIFEYVLVV